MLNVGVGLMGIGGYWELVGCVAGSVLPWWLICEAWGIEIVFVGCEKSAFSFQVFGALFVGGPVGASA